MGHTGQTISCCIWESRASLFVFCWSWFKFTVVHIWRAELDNSWVVTGNTIISVSANRHEAVGQVSASVSSALWEQAGPWQKSPATHCLHSHQITVIIAEGSLCGGNAGKWSFLYVEKINYWDQIYRKMYYCSMRLDKIVWKNGDGSVFL